MFLVKLAVRLAFFAMFAMFVLPLLIPFFGIQGEPRVQQGSSLTQADAERVTALLRQNDPRSLADGETRSLLLTPRDLNLLLGHAIPFASKQWGRLVLSDHSAVLDYTLALPSNPLGDYLNLSVDIAEQGGELYLAEARLGDAMIPGWLVNLPAKAIDKLLTAKNEVYRDVMAALESVQLSPEAARVTYRWQADLLDRIEDEGRDLLLPPAERERVLVYYGEIARLSSRALQGRSSLAELLQPLFELALERSASSGQPAAENRALLLALGAVVNGSDIESLTGEQAIIPVPRPMQLTLRGRDDLVKHFVISAALAAGGGESLADTVGVFKELDDSRGGSGFSFPDLLADRAGVELATTATGSDAGVLQERMASGLQEGDFMPPIDRLPEGLQEMEFKSRYQDLDNTAYAQVKQEIDNRIAACAVYRQG
jgi:hypothetical protein